MEISMENLYVETWASRVKRDCTGLYGILLLKYNISINPTSLDPLPTVIYNYNPVCLSIISHNLLLTNDK